MTEPHAIFDRALLRCRRSRAAAAAPAHDFLLRRVADDFAGRVNFLVSFPGRRFACAANVGAWHGTVSRTLMGSGAVSWIADIEECPRLLDCCGGARILAREEALPLASGACGLVVSGLSLHLVDDLPGVLVQIRRALAPGGLFLGALLGGGTLRELRDAWICAESELCGGASPRVAPFADVRTLGGLLQRAGFVKPVADSDTVTATYASPLALMQDLKGMGASNMLLARRRVPVTRGLLLRAAEVYRERYGLADGRIPATFEIVTLTGFAPDGG